MSDRTPDIAPIWSATGSLAPEYFQHLYAHSSDPWEFATSAYEAAKYAATLRALPRDHYRQALELGCSIGVFTQLLAPRCRDLLAVDISDAALLSARERCLVHRQVNFARTDLSRNFPAGHFDLIVVSEVGYYLSMPDLLHLRDRIADALLPGGHLLLVHYTGGTNYPLTADAVHRAFLKDEREPWKALHSASSATYRLDVLEQK